MEEKNYIYGKRLYLIILISHISAKVDELNMKNKKKLYDLVEHFVNQDITIYKFGSYIEMDIHDVTDGVDG